MTMEAETGVMWPQAQGYMEVPATRSGRNDPLLESPEGAQPADTSILDFWPPEVHSYCCKPPVCGTLLGQPPEN